MFAGTPLLFAQAQAASASASSASEDTVVEEIVARVNNNIITRADLRKAREQLYGEAQGQQDKAAAETAGP